MTVALEVSFHRTFQHLALLAFERIGEVLVSVVVLVFSNFNLKPWTNWSWWLVASFVLMILYEIFWIRYFRSAKTMQDFYCTLLGIPVPGATLPVLASLLLALYGRNIILGLSVLILGIGHIGIHLIHKKEITEQYRGKTWRLHCSILGTLFYSLPCFPISSIFLSCARMMSNIMVFFSCSG